LSYERSHCSIPPLDLWLRLVQTVGGASTP